MAWKNVYKDLWINKALSEFNWKLNSDYAKPFKRFYEFLAENNRNFPLIQFCTKRELTIYRFISLSTIQWNEIIIESALRPQMEIFSAGCQYATMSMPQDVHFESISLILGKAAERSLEVTLKKILSITSLVLFEANFHNACELWKIQLFLSFK